MSAAETASRSYYKSFPIMDFSHYHPAMPPPLQPKEKSYIHQPQSAHHNMHTPLAISIPSSHLEQSHLPKTATHPFLVDSAFKAWEPAGRHVHRQTSAPAHTSSLHGSTRRHGCSTRRQQSTENMADVFNKSYGGTYEGGAGQELQQTAQPSYYPHGRQKSYSTHSATEVTV